MAKFSSNDRLTLGIEEELQIVDPSTGELVSHVEPILEHVDEGERAHIHGEFYQSMVEIATPVCGSVDQVREALTRLRGRLSEVAARDDLAIAAAGTHPMARWEEQDVTRKQRYRDTIELVGLPARFELVFGQHVHVAVGSRAEAIFVMNNLRPFLPVLLALSANSPMWKGYDTGLRSTRLRTFDAMPRTGLPRTFRDWEDFRSALDLYVKTGGIDDITRLWWDVRPRPSYGTLEVRICDVSTDVDTSVALAGLVQALVATLTQAHDRGLEPPEQHDHEVIVENRWRALRYGLEAGIVQRGPDGSVEEVAVVDALDTTLEHVGDAVADLGLEDEMAHLRSRAKQRVTGAQRQLDVLHRTGEPRAVVDDILERTSVG